MYVRNRNRGCIQGCLVLVIMLAIGGFVVSLAFSNLDEYASSNGDVEIDARSIEVPNVTGMDIGEATAELESLGLEVETVEESDFCYTAGHVSEQFPTGQTKTGSTVTLTVSTTPDMYDVYMAKNVPDVRGYTVDEAVDTLTAGGWVVDGIDGPADGIAVDFDVTDVGGRTGTLIAQEERKNQDGMIRCRLSAIHRGGAATFLSPQDEDAGRDGMSLVDTRIGRSHNACNALAHTAL